MWSSCLTKFKNITILTAVAWGFVTGGTTVSATRFFWSTILVDCPSSTTVSYCHDRGGGTCYLRCVHLMVAWHEQLKQCWRLYGPLACACMLQSDGFKSKIKMKFLETASWDNGEHSYVKCCRGHTIVIDKKKNDKSIYVDILVCHFIISGYGLGRHGMPNYFSQVFEWLVVTTYGKNAFELRKIIMWMWDKDINTICLVTVITKTYLCTFGNSAETEEYVMYGHSVFIKTCTKWKHSTCISRHGGYHIILNQSNTQVRNDSY